MGHSDDLGVVPVTHESKYSTFVFKRQVSDADGKKKSRPNKSDGSPRKSPKKRKNEVALTSDAETTPVRCPNAMSAFNVRAASTPKFTPVNLFSSTVVDEAPKLDPVNLFSSTVIEETPKRRKVPSQSILEKSSIFEDSSRSANLSSSYAKTSFCVPRRQLSQSLLERTSMFERSPRADQTCSTEEPAGKVSKSRCFLERNIRSVDPILFQRVETDWPSPTSTLKVRDIVKRLEVTESFDNTLERKSISMQIKSSSATEQETPIPSKRQPAIVLEKHASVSSPCTKFLTSRRKSTDLEKVIKSKQPSRGKGVKVIIETLTKKLGKSFPRLSQTSEVGEDSFVKKVVNALEKGDVRSAKNADSPASSAHEDSSSESEVKSCTSASLKDTDSSSDSDQRSPGFKSDEERTFTYERKSKTLPLKKKARSEDDSVYWIPVSRCKLPRTSSLLSMMSRLSTNTQSPCVSPIRSESETENADWGATFKKNHCLSRKLFRIDETTVIDSGYSDRSDRSVVGGSSLTDSAWSEDTQIDSGSESKSAKVKRSSRRKSIGGQTHCIH